MKVFYKPELKIGEISKEDLPIGGPLYKIVFDDGSVVCTYSAANFDFVSQ